MKNKKGFTVVELIASFTLTMLISVFLFEVLIEVKDVFVETAIKTKVEKTMAVVYKNLKSIPNSIANCDGNTITVTGETGSESFKLPDDVTVNCDLPSGNQSFLNYKKFKFTVESNEFKDKILLYDAVYYNSSSVAPVDPGSDVPEQINIVQRLYVKSDGNDETGDGTESNPFKTIKKAYTVAEKLSGNNYAGIYVMDNITVDKNSTATMNEEKQIVLLSSTVEPNTVSKAEALGTNLIKISKGKLVLQNITLDGKNIADTERGFVVGKNSKLSIYDRTTIQNFKNTAKLWGATIFVEKGSSSEHGEVIIYDGNIINNTNQNECGAAIAADEFSKVTINKGTITGNTSTDGGAITMAGNTTLTINNGTISNNTSTKHGGAIYTFGILNMNNGTISNNTAPEGGGVYNKSGTLTMNGGTITGNTATSYGGGIRAVSSSTVNLNGGTISSNTATKDGGGINSDSATVNVNGTTISNNISKTNGGGIVCYKSTCVLKKGTISNNTATSDGGGIHNTGTLTISGGTISSNKGYTGGGISSSSKINITGGKISDNEATRDAGGIYCSSSCTITMENNVVSGNTGNRLCGGVDIDGSLTMSGSSQVINNKCTNDFGGNFGSSGGVRIGANATFIMNNGTISNNTAATHGGGIATSSNSNVTINNGTISNNTAPEGGGVYNNSGTLTMNGGTITGNTATTGSGGAIYAYGTVYMTGGNITRNTANTFGGGLMCKKTCNLSGGSITSNSVNVNEGSGVRNDGTLNISGNINIKDNQLKNYLGDISNTGTISDERIKFRFDTGLYYITVNRAQQLVLDVSGGKAANDTNVQIYTQNTSNAQKWRIVPKKVENGKLTYYFASAVGGSQHLWVAGNSYGNSQNVITYQLHSNTGGIFALERTHRDDGQIYADYSGVHTIRTYGNTCIDIVGGTIASGTNVQNYACNNSAAQRFKFIKA